MKVTKLKIKSVFLIFIIVIFSIFPNCVLAIPNSNTLGEVTTLAELPKTFDEIIKNGNDFVNIGNSSQLTNETEIENISSFVSGCLITIAIGVTVISAVIMGINFLTQTVDDKAKIKESMTPWVIGIFISFGAFGIWKLTMNIFMDL